MSGRPLKVLYLKQRFDPEPAPLRGAAFTDAMRAHGIDFDVLTGFPYYPHRHVYAGYDQRWYRRDTVGETVVHRSRSVVGHSGGAGRRLLSYVTMPAMSTATAWKQRLDADLVLTTLGPAVYAHFALLTARRLKVPCVLEMQDLWPESLIASGMWPGWAPLRPIHGAMSFAYRRAAAVTALSPGCREAVIERGADPSTTVSMLNWAPSVAISDDDARTAAGLVGDWSGTDFIAYAGAIGRLQGVDRMIDAAHRIGARLLIVGDGRHAEALRQRAEDTGALVRFVGQQPLGVAQRILELSAATSVYLESSELDGSAIPSKVAANLTAGVPMVVAARGETRRLADRVDAGPRCDPGDTASLADMYKTVLDASTDQRRAWSMAAQRFAANTADATTGFDRYARFLRAVAEGTAMDGLVDSEGALL